MLILDYPPSTKQHVSVVSFCELIPYTLIPGEVDLSYISSIPALCSRNWSNDYGIGVWLYKPGLINAMNDDVMSPGVGDMWPSGLHSGRRPNYRRSQLELFVVSKCAG